MRVDRRRFLQTGATALAALGLGRVHPAGAQAGAATPQTTGEPYELLGRRLVFTSWQFIRPGLFRYVDSTGRQVTPDGPPPVGEVTRQPVDRPIGVRLVAQPAERIGPMLSRVKRWELAGSSIWSMFRDGDRYRAWGLTQPAWDRSLAAYFESEDGLVWRRPNLGLVEFGGSRENNILPLPVLGSVFVDPSGDAAERYKWVGTATISRDELEAFRASRPDGWEPRAIRNEGALIMAIRGAVSPDGIHWTMLPEPLAVEHSDSQVTGYYDAVERKYVLYTRNWMVGQASARAAPQEIGWLTIGRRSIGRAESSDFRRFPVSEVILTPPHWMEPSDLLYGNARTTIPGAPDHHLMFPSVWHADDSMSVHLASSHDGQAWSWLSTAPILTKGPPGAWDSGYVFAHVELTELPDGSWALPYSGFDIPHKAPRFDAIVRTGYARWPHGRLVAVEAQGDGEFSTAAFYPPSEQLRVNVRTASGGSVRIEARTRTGAPIPGRSFEDATPIAGDQPAASVRWGVNEDLGREPGQAVYLRFRLSRAELFGIEFV